MPLDENFKVGDRVILTSLGTSWRCTVHNSSKLHPLFGSQWECEGTISGIYDNIYIEVKWDNGYCARYGPDHLDVAIGFKVGDRVILTQIGTSWSCTVSIPGKRNPLQGNSFECEGTIKAITFMYSICVYWDNGYDELYGPGHLQLVNQKVSKKPKLEEHPLAALRDVIKYDPYGKRTHPALWKAHLDRQKKKSYSQKSIKQMQGAYNKVAENLSNY